MKIFCFITVLAVSLSLTSCIDAAFSSGRYAKLEGERQVWQQLAFARDTEAQYKLATLYCCGERPKYNDIKALYWWCQAGKAGQSESLLEIGKMYEGFYQHKGSIIPKDETLAYTYYSLSAENNNSEADSYKNTLAERLTKSDIEKAEKYLAKWPDIPCDIER